MTLDWAHEHRGPQRVLRTLQAEEGWRRMLVSCVYQQSMAGPEDQKDGPTADLSPGMGLA